MRAFLAELEEREGATADTPHNFRLNRNPFFLKFCPRVICEPDDLGLIPGMYLPLDYWSRLITSAQLDGPRGGKALRFANAARHLNNSEFVTLVMKAWVGTPLEQSTILEKVILKTLESGRAVTLAQVTTQGSSSSADASGISPDTI